MITALELNNPAITGRLGNQLFVMAACLGIASRFNDTAVFSEWSYAPFFANPPHISSTLDHSQFQDYEEPHFHFTPIPYHPYLNLKGYFQSEKYFQEQSNVIRAHFSPHSSIIKAISIKYGSMLSNSVSVHVRRDNYLTRQDTHPILPFSYYQEAISRYDSLATLFIFSDDIEWCKTAFNDYKNRCVFVENQPDIVDLFVMSRCTHHIIVNSSFSWWGAWLNPSMEKTVIAPSPWFGKKINHDSSDLIPETWTQLKWSGEKKSFWSFLG